MGALAKVKVVEGGGRRSQIEENRQQGAFDVDVDSKFVSLCTHELVTRHERV